jgi:hypothetical protein
MIWRRALLISSKIMNSIINKAPGTGTVETAHVASIDSISFVIVYMNLHRCVGICIFSDSTRLYRRYEEICGGSCTYKLGMSEVNGCFSPFCLPSATRAITSLWNF